MAKRVQMPKSAGTGAGRARPTPKKQVGSPVVLWGVIGAVVLVLVGVILLQVQSVNKPIQVSGVIAEGTGWGPADAPVKIVEYSDFGCTYCRQFALNQGRQLREEYEKTGKVRFEYKSFIIEGQSTREAANAAYCAADQGRFWDYADVLFNRSGTGAVQSVFARSALKEYGAQIGLDMARFNKCVDGGQFIPDVQNQHSEGERLGVQATPTFFINGQKIEGAAPYAEFKRLIDGLLAAASSGPVREKVVQIAPGDDPVEHRQRPFDGIFVGFQKRVHGPSLPWGGDFDVDLPTVHRPSDRRHYYATETGRLTSFWLRPEAG